MQHAYAHTENRRKNINQFSVQFSAWNMARNLYQNNDRELEKKTHTFEIGKRQQIDQFLHVIINTRILRWTRDVEHMRRDTILSDGSALKMSLFFSSLGTQLFVVRSAVFVSSSSGPYDAQMRFVKNDEQIN